MLCAGYSLGQLFGWSSIDSIFLGAILSISSTTIIIKALGELGLSKKPFAELIFGILIVEDILAIVMIALLSGFATTGSFAVADIGMTVLKLGSFLGILLVAGLILVPRLLNYVVRFKSNEMLLVTVLGLCFGVSLLAVRLEYSVALGAFLIGAIIAEARQIARIETLARTGARHVQRSLFRLDWFADRSSSARPLCRAHPCRHRRGRGGQGALVHVRGIRRRPSTGRPRSGSGWVWRRSASFPSSSPPSGCR